MDRVLGLLLYFFSWLAKHTKWLAAHGIGRYEEWQPGERLKILLVGYNGARNTGADARVVAITRQLKEIFGEGKIQISVMALDTENLAGYFDPDVQLYHFTTLFPLSVYRACSTHHMAILSEGSALKSTFADALTMFFCEAAGIMRSQHKPCIAYGSEVGQMAPYLQKIASDLCGDTYFIARTAESLDVLQTLGLKGHQGTDTAWMYDGSISREKAREWLKSQGWDGKEPCFGMAVIDPFCWPVHASLGKWLKGVATGRMEGQYDKWYFFSQSPERTEAFEKYLAAVAAAMNGFMEKHGGFPVLIGMERLDAAACQRVQGLLHRPAALLLSGDYPASQMVGVIRELSLLLTSRYHAAVLSMERALPIVAVSMDERHDSLLKEVGMEDQFLFHVGDEDLERELSFALEEAYSRREEVHGQILTHFTRYQAELRRMGVFLKTYVSERLGVL